jgi:hypothetical protein
MNGFWEFLIRPALEAAAAQVVVEVGSEGGCHTELLLDWCALRKARLHVVEPAPQYDVDELMAVHRERLVFHRATSLEVLDRLGPVDAVLLDGDHNWFTVYHELKSLEAVYGSHFPLVFLHDVAWPFARRDMYYEPSRIPPAYRHPYAKGGVLPGESKLLQGDGLAPELYKAEEEGGSRNGVLTAVEDFLGETALALRLELVSVGFGLGLLTSEALQQERPALRSLLDSLHTPEFLERLVSHTEERRVRDLIDLWRRIAEAEARGQLATQKLSAAQAQLNGVLGSTSWRLTSPLRWLKGRLRGRPGSVEAVAGD